MNTTIKVLNRELEDLRTRADKERDSKTGMFLWAEIRRVESEITAEEQNLYRAKVWG